MTVKGLASLNRKFKRLPVLARQEIGKAMERIASRVVALARSLVPVDDGDLRDSIHWTWGDAPKGSMTLGEIRGGSRSGNLSIRIVAGNDEVFWARWVEFGTSGHLNAGLFAGTKNPGTSAQPYFYPAWRASRKSVKAALSRAISKSAKKAAAGA